MKHYEVTFLHNWKEKVVQVEASTKDQARKKVRAEFQGAHIVHTLECAMTNEIPKVRFLNDDPMGLWKAGDVARDLGQEHPSVPVWTLQMIHNGELISLTNPYERNLIERLEKNLKEGGRFREGVQWKE